MTTDEELMSEFRQGSREAFEEIFQRHREALYGFFRRRLHDAACAEDLAQETFLAVIRGVARYEPRALVRTYLYGIALNLLAAERRQRARDGGSLGSASDPPVDADPDAALWVRQAMERLDAGEREILMLREYEQLSYSEIGELLRIPVNTVRSRLFRGRMALKSLLAEDKGRKAQRPEARNIARPLVQNWKLESHKGAAPGSRTNFEFRSSIRNRQSGFVRRPTQRK
jgi:RNA polymerase sigma-70 factor, ECF subfamily